MFIKLSLVFVKVTKYFAKKNILKLHFL